MSIVQKQKVWTAGTEILTHQKRRAAQNLNLSVPLSHISFFILSPKFMRRYLCILCISQT